MRRRPVFISALSLLVVLVACKAIVLVPARPGIAAFASDLLVATHRDLFFAVVSAVAGWIVLQLSPVRRRFGRILWRYWVVYTTAVVFYAVLSLHIYTILFAPLTYRLIASGHGLAVGWSSIRSWLSLDIILALVLVPVAHVSLLRAAGRSKTWSSPIVPALKALFFVVVLVLAAEGSYAYEKTWPSRPDNLIAESPHLVLLRSLWATLHHEDEFLGRDDEAVARIQDLGFDFPPEARLDFASAAAGLHPLYSPTPPRNVLVYVLESTPAEALDSYGSSYGVTPRLAEYASHGWQFDNIYAQVGRSEGSLVDISLSTYVPLLWRRVTEVMPTMKGTTLAQLLAPRGYRTAHLSATELAWGAQRGFLANRGYDVVKDGSDFKCPAVSTWGVSDACLVDQVLDWVDADRSRPFFAVAWTNQTHHPYVFPSNVARPKFVHQKQPRRVSDFDAYLNALAESDRQLGRLLDGLNARGLAEDTLVVITGDHGEAFGARHASILHGFSVYEEDIRVPCILINPRLFSDGRRISTLGSHIDLTPTIAHVLGVPFPEGWQGRSLFDSDRSGRVYSFAAHRDLILAVREGKWKYILDMSTGLEEMYDLDADPDEQHSVPEREPQLRQRLRAYLAAWVRVQKERYRQGALTMDRTSHIP